MHYRKFYDANYVGAHDLDNRDVTLTIREVKQGKLKNPANPKEAEQRKIVIFFVGPTKGFVVNLTNSRTIAAMYGDDTDKWIGKRITIYPTTTKFGRETKECIRVRPGAPAASKPTGTLPEPEPVPSAPDHEREAAT